MNDSSEQGRNRRPKKGPGKRGISTTIVGGRPPREGGQWAKVPRGVEVLIKKASVDMAFRQVLLDKRAEAAHEIDLELSPAEVALLNSAPRAQIEKIIERTTVPDEHRRVFLGKMGTAMVALLTLGVAGCTDEVVGTVVVTIEELPGVVLGVTATPPQPRVVTATPQPRVVTATPPPATPAPIPEGTGKLDVSIVDERAGSVTVLVSYECPFEQGEIRIRFRQDRNLLGATLDYEPVPLVIVPSGSGEITFDVQGTEGTTNWIVVRLRSTDEQCQRAPRVWPLDEYLPGEYIVGNCVIWKMIEFHKVWREE